MTIEQLISEIRYQLPLGVTTFGPCATEVCENTARGSRRCIECLRYDLYEQMDYEAVIFVAHSMKARESALSMLKREDK